MNKFKKIGFVWLILPISKTILSEVAFIGFHSNINLSSIKKANTKQKTIQWNKKIKVRNMFSNISPPIGSENDEK